VLFLSGIESTVPVTDTTHVRNMNIRASSGDFLPRSVFHLLVRVPREQSCCCGALWSSKETELLLQHPIVFQGNRAATPAPYSVPRKQSCYSSTLSVPRKQSCCSSALSVPRKQGCYSSALYLSKAPELLLQHPIVFQGNRAAGSAPYRVPRKQSCCSSAL